MEFEETRQHYDKLSSFLLTLLVFLYLWLISRASVKYLYLCISQFIFLNNVRFTQFLRILLCRLFLTQTYRNETNCGIRNLDHANHNSFTLTFTTVAYVFKEYNSQKKKCTPRVNRVAVLFYVCFRLHGKCRFYYARCSSQLVRTTKYTE